MPKPLGTQPLGVALIGAGMIAPSHVAALWAMRARARLAAIVSTRPERAAYLAESYPQNTPIFTSDLDAVIADRDIQMVIVATPPNVRIDLIGRLAQAGMHILLEKPVARTTAEAEQVVQICEEAGVTLGVLFQHRVQASSRAAARHIASGALGRLGHVEIAVPLWRPQSYYDALGRGTYARDGGGVLMTQAIHTIDLALSLTGPVDSVQAMTATSPLHRMEAEDVAVAGLRFANGAVGSFVASTASFGYGQETITLHFERGSMRIGRETFDLTWRSGQDALDPDPAPDPSDQEIVQGPARAKYILHQGVIEDFVTAVNTGRAPMVTGRTALAAHRFIEAIETSSFTGQRVSVAR